LRWDPVAGFVRLVDGARVTPPLECALLPGVRREELLERREIREQVVLKDDLRRLGQIWLISSLRGWRCAAQSRSR